MNNCYTILIARFKYNILWPLLTSFGSAIWSIMEHRCIKKIVYIQTGLNYLPRQRTGWWPVWRPPQPCGEERSGGTGWSQMSPCWSRQWRLRQKTHRLSRRDYISQFLLSRFLSKTFFKTWNQKVKHCVYTASYWADQWDRLTCRFGDALDTQVSARQVLSVHQYVVLTGMLVYSGKND